MRAAILPLFILLLAGCTRVDHRVVGPSADGSIITTGQLIRPAGENLVYAGRPIDLVVAPDGRTIYVKDTDAMMVLDASSWTIRHRIAFNKDERGSMHGIAVTRDGAKIYLTTSDRTLIEASAGGITRRIELPAFGKDEAVHATGVALSPDERAAYVCLSRNNSVAVVDLAAGKITREIPVGVCPFDIALSNDGSTAFVSNFGGRIAGINDRTAKSAGTDVVVDERGISVSGTVSVIDLSQNKVINEIEVGLHPSDLEPSADGSTLYVANANSDGVSVIDTRAAKVSTTIPIRVDERLPFGSICSALKLSGDGRTLYVAAAGNNAIAVVDLSNHSVRGFIPTAWFPGSVATDGEHLFIANVKGVGSRNPDPKRPGFNSKRYLGSIQRVKIPDSDLLATFTAQVKRDARVPQALAAMERRDVPAPLSNIKHVFFVLKENRTYDQVFGDIARGNGDPGLCIYGKDITPNHHALAEQFVLLDNYYCNGVVSADGHQWATQGIVTDYQEKHFGGWTRGYDFGTDALAYAPTNFLWDSILLGGLSFRNYGEFDFPVIRPDKSTWFDIFAQSKLDFTSTLQIDMLRKYTCPTYPGWDMRISDQYRVDRFLEEFAGMEKSGDLPNFVFIYLPQDHTAGTSENAPTPRAHLADNDLALGRLVDAVSHSRFWKDSVIIVNEDDPQDGWDHVDGHRSICLVIGPHVKRGVTISNFYNQTSVLHTITNIFGLPPMNQQVAQSPSMEACFTPRANLTPFNFIQTTIPLDERNPKKAAISGEQLNLARASEAMNLVKPDRIDDDELNRILWHAARGIDAPYPKDFAGAHGRGLPALKLKFDAGIPADDDD